MRKGPALAVYDGPDYRLLRKFLATSGWPPGLQVKILSAKYGLIDAMEVIETYDQRLTQAAASRMRRRVLSTLGDLPQPRSVFVSLGVDYLPAVEGLRALFSEAKLTYARGGIGLKMHKMKRWLSELPNRTAGVPRRAAEPPSYLYFFPDWDDYVYEPFKAEETDEHRRAEGVKRTYAHELFGSSIPFDGVLLSLSQIHAGKGALYHAAGDGRRRVRLRRRLRIPKHILLFGDCGAFSYAAEPSPPFTPTEAARLYHKYGFDIGASVDHIPLPVITKRSAEGEIEKSALSRSARYDRMYLTRDNAREFLSQWKRHGYSFVPLGVVQGVGPDSYAARVREYLEMGYRHIAIGGLVPRSDVEIVDVLSAVRNAIQESTRERRKNVWLHLFGIVRPRLQSTFRWMGVSSFDSASYFRKAWLRSDQNYLAPDGRSWYGTIRVPISTSKAVRLAAHAEGLTEGELAKMEQRCLNAIEACDKKPSARSLVIGSVGHYGPLLARKGEDNHFADKHASLLKDRPWERCSCPSCRSAGIHVVVFRGASRNKRRGLHNTWVFYHKVLHGDAIPTCSPGNE